MTLEKCYVVMGADYDGVISRLKNTNLISKYVIAFLSDSNYDILCTAIRKKNFKEAFLAAHTLKGICLNLGFTDLYNSSNSMTESLKNEDEKAMRKFLRCLQKDYKMTVAAIRRFAKSI